ncbi:MAG: hypothetical protein PQJ44_06990 [Sphaerochaetaceae bacterium]|nr:hypothetical protein [Sphaerochaetaceae bacterium]
MKTIVIDNEEYVRKSDLISEDEEYVLVRTYSAGVFFCTIESRNGKEAVLRNARRIWYWDGAASLSELATKGTSKPENCKFTCYVDKTEVTEVVEVLYCTKEAIRSIKGVKEWTAHDE